MLKPKLSTFVFSFIQIDSVAMLAMSVRAQFGAFEILKQFVEIIGSLCSRLMHLFCRTLRPYSLAVTIQ